MEGSHFCAGCSPASAVLKILQCGRIHRLEAYALSESRPLLSVIIVSVNTGNWLKPCLESLLSQSIRDSLEVVVVDNGSSDGSADMVRRMFPVVKLVRLEETVGFGKANNVGAGQSRAPILLFLNPDTKLREDSLSPILARFEDHPRCGVAGGVVLDDRGEFERSSGSLPSLFSMGTGRLLKHVPPARPFLGRLSHQHWSGYNESRRVDWVTGAFLWIRRDVFRKAGGFDEEFFMYCEDVDLCYRASQLGFQCWFFHDAAIVHYRGKSPVPRPRRRMLFESLHCFGKKHYRLHKYPLTRFVFWIQTML